jgi:hypothetical protein
VLSECLSLATGEVYDIPSRIAIGWAMFLCVETESQLRKWHRAGLFNCDSSR